MPCPSQSSSFDHLRNNSQNITGLTQAAPDNSLTKPAVYTKEIYIICFAAHKEDKLFITFVRNETKTETGTNR
jgi:hypothetical protein